MACLWWTTSSEKARSMLATRVNNKCRQHVPERVHKLTGVSNAPGDCSIKARILGGCHTVHDVPGMLPSQRTSRAGWLGWGIPWPCFHVHRSDRVLAVLASWLLAHPKRDDGAGVMRVHRGSVLEDAKSISRAGLPSRRRSPLHARALLLCMHADTSGRLARYSL